MDEMTRLRIWRRDGFKCVYCGYDGGTSYKTIRYLGIDHFKPVASGGGEEDENLFTACDACNRDKGARQFNSLADAQRWLRLSRKECSQPWFDAYVTGNKDAQDSRRNAEKQRRRLQERFDAGEDEPEEGAS